MTMADVAKEYGQALFELAEEEHIDGLILDELRVLRQILKSNPDLLKLLDAPNINLEDRIKVIDNIFKGKMHVYLCSFLKLMTERRHSPEIFSCLDEYEECYSNKNAIIEAHVSSAVELSETQKESLFEKLREKAGKNVVVKYHVEPELLGGIRVNMDGKLFEGTVRARLDELRNSLKKETL